jgi:hypothetical protein
MEAIDFLNHAKANGGATLINGALLRPGEPVYLVALNGGYEFSIRTKI